jgi:hypothetical protein
LSEPKSDWQLIIHLREENARLREALGLAQSQGEPVAWAPWHPDSGFDIPMVRRKEHTVKRYIESAGIDAVAKPLYAAPANPKEADNFDPAAWKKITEDRATNSAGTHACLTCCGDGYINIQANLPDVACTDCGGTGRGPAHDPTVDSVTSTDEVKP